MKRKWFLIATVILLGVIGFAYGKYEHGAVNFVSGTEYQIGERGSTIVSVTNVFGDPISVDWCNETIYYPNKTVFVDNQPMTQGGAPASWYYEFTVPNQLGNYEQYVVCQVHTITGTRLIKARKAFHAQQTLTLLNETATAQINILT